MSNDEEYDERLRLARYMLVDGRAPCAFVRHFLKTGVMDGTLWPITWPIHYAPPAGDRDMTG